MQKIAAPIELAFDSGGYLESFNKKPGRGILVDFSLKIAVPSLLLLGCSAPATKMKCAELQYRLNHQTLSDDEKRVLEDELKECEHRVDTASQQDSITLKKFENHFSPEEDSL